MLRSTLFKSAFYFVLCLGITSLHAAKKDRQKINLKDNGGYHFLFEGSNYTFMIDTLGSIKLIPLKLIQGDVKIKRIKDHFNLNYLLKERKSKNDQAGIPIEKLATEFKQSRSSFQLTYLVTFEGNHQVSIQFLGTKQALKIQTEAKHPESLDFNYRFHVSEEKDQAQKGRLDIATKENKRVTLNCEDPFNLKKNSYRLKQVSLKQRVFDRVLFSIKSSQESMYLAQRSHNKGANLNSEFTIVYQNQSLWNKSNNLITLAF